MIKAKKSVEAIETDLTTNIKEAGLDSEGLSKGLLSVPQIGIKLPGLGLELLFGSTVLPFGSLYTIGAPPGAGKSTLAWEFCRLCMCSGGRGLCIDNENKFLDEIAGSIMYTSKLDLSKFSHESVTSFNEMQKILLEECKDIIGRCGPKYSYDEPEMLIIDSVTGNDTDVSIAKVMSEGGVVNKSYSDTAWFSAKLLQTLPAVIAPLPAIVLAICHTTETPGNGPFQASVITRKGGKSWDYRSRNTWLISRVGRDVNYEGTDTYKPHTARQYLIKLTKGKYESCKIPYTVRWFKDKYIDPLTGEARSNQKTIFAWHESSCKVLRTPAEYNLPSYVCEAIRDIVDIKQIDTVRGTSMFTYNYYAPKLGIAKEDALPPKKFMDVLYADTKLLAELRASCGIEVGIPFNTGDKYEKLRHKAIEIAKQQMEARVQAGGFSFEDFEG